MNPYTYEVLLRERRREMLEYAERRRLLAAYEASFPSQRARLFAALGKCLVAAGERLIRRYESRVEISAA